MAIQDQIPQGSDFRDQPPIRLGPPVQLGPPIGPRRRGLWTAVVVGSALAAGAAIALPSLSWAEERTATVSWTATHDVTAVQIAADSGDVWVMPGPPGAATVTGSLNWNNVRPQVTEEWRGDTLFVSETCPARAPFDDCSAGLTVTVPADTAVSGEAHGGDLGVLGLSGAIHVQVESGDVQLTGDTGAIWARADSGEIDGERLGSAQVDAGALSGDVTLRFAAPPQSVTVSVASGSATVVVPQGSTYRVGGQTLSGDRNVESGVADASSSRSLSVTAQSGDVGIGYPDQYGD
jgi:hypothetical protein